MVDDDLVVDQQPFRYAGLHLRGFVHAMAQLGVEGITLSRGLDVAEAATFFSTIAERNGIVYFANACSGAVYKVPLASLTDSRQPWRRAADIRLLSPKPASTEVEELLSMIFNPENPRENYMYAADAMRMRLIRINTVTGKRQVLGDEHELFNFPSSLSFMPTLSRSDIFPQLVVVSNQQQLTPITNDLAPGDNFEFPFIATRVVLNRD